MGSPAVVPPAGREVGGGRAPAGALAERGWGAFAESAEGTCAPRGLVPYREVAAAPGAAKAGSGSR